MSLKTQGTELWFVDPADDAIVKVGCPTSIGGISAGRDQLETTCLDSAAREYEAGLATPGQASVGLNFDPADPSHVRLHELYAAGTKLNWALGLSDGIAPPTSVDTDGDFVLPATRSFITLNGYIADFPFDLSLNAVVTSTLSIQVSNFPLIFPKTP